MTCFPGSEVDLNICIPATSFTGMSGTWFPRELLAYWVAGTNQGVGGVGDVEDL